MIGNFKNIGQSWCLEAEQVQRIMTSRWMLGLSSPLWNFDVVNQNRGDVDACQSADTAEFAVDVLVRWWQEFGHFDFPDAPYLLVMRLRWKQR